MKPGEDETAGFPRDGGSFHEMLMDVVLYAFLGVGVAAIFCLYRRYLTERIHRLRTLRMRMTLMLWAAANSKADD